MSRDDLRRMHRPGTEDLATVVALIRASLTDDDTAMVALVRGLDPAEDDLRGVVIHLARLCAAALLAGEGGRDGAHACLDLLAAHVRGETP